MLRNVFLKALRDQRRVLLGWSLGIVLLVALEAALWPSIKEMPGLQELLASYPEGVRKLFKLEEVLSGRGFMNVELFSALLPVLFIAFGIGRGARAIAGEEEAGTLEILLVSPVSPARLLLRQAAALAVATGTLGVVLYGSLFGFSAVFGLGIGAGEAGGATLAMVLLGVEFGWLALALGAATGRRGVAIAAASTIAVAAYVLYVAGEFVESVRPWQPISPFHQALHEGPLGAGLPLSYAWMALAGAVVVAAAMPVFDRRDVGTHS